MNKQQIEKIVGHELHDNAISLDKKIYAGILYFYKREIEQDHYFYVPTQQRLYKMNFSPDNYDPSKTETASKPDSFQFKFDQLIAEGRVEQIVTFNTEDTIKVEVKTAQQEINESEIEMYKAIIDQNNTMINSLELANSTLNNLIKLKQI